MGGDREYKKQRKGGKKVSPLHASSRQTAGMSKKKLESEEIESDDGAVVMSEATMDEIVRRLEARLDRKQKEKYDAELGEH